MKRARGYIFSRTFMGERVPQHVQNLVIRDYCDRNGLQFLLSATEYAMPSCHLIFEQVMQQLDGADALAGIVAYSLYQLPESAAQRARIYAHLVARSKFIGFAVEGLRATSAHEFERIETLWRVRQTMARDVLLASASSTIGSASRYTGGHLRNFVTPLHQATKRDYLGRMLDDKVHCMGIAKQYGELYWDGERRYGYGGYHFRSGYWKPVAQALIDAYLLGPGSKVLDVGCGKAFLLHEMLLLQPELQVTGIDISAYALDCATEGVKPHLSLHKAEEYYPYADNSFDLVISLATLHNLPLPALKKALMEIARVGKSAYLMVESYRNDQELFNLQCWALTCETFLGEQDWRRIFAENINTADYEFIFFE